MENKKRNSLFPWRGQFSPQLVEYLLAENSSNDFSILDPFCGCGTTLYEAARKNFTCYGTDVNPAAYIFSSIINFCARVSSSNLV
ncbi:DNA methyltransferase [Anabaenopsis tanganyikae CS-531]|uniref:DNA methyltransferase n=2 Tax=Anabaenopsis TaxID=110103 RepID=A0ABT6KAC9_9CYAN|nr:MULTISPECIES: DNA methyltransferase [Anabaenopsis]MDB9541142.1 DNA methyltransferase [Anabaenopsis arnoldii]MDH6093581.1 DNA methyltransferase [Anabaenopsis arnoldii]MDH6104779.1 DNA methyltransferase [Anabaenopsis tanganyikae CS-531]